MKPFKNIARYPDFEDGYNLYSNRSVSTPDNRILAKQQYKCVVKEYCKALAERLENEGVADLPSDMGAIVAVNIQKRPVYNRMEGKYKPARNIDWNAVRETGKFVYKDNPNTFGFVFVPRHMKNRGIFRCFGFVANKALYKRLRNKYDDGILPFYLADKDMYSL